MKNILDGFIHQIFYIQCMKNILDTAPPECPKQEAAMFPILQDLTTFMTCLADMDLASRLLQYKSIFLVECFQGIAQCENSESCFMKSVEIRVLK